jgi:hypothetical protein
MQSTFTINLLDLMMYFVPGILLLVPVIKHAAPHLFDLDHSKLGLLRYLTVVGACFLIGVVLFKLSGLYIYPYDAAKAITGQPRIGHMESLLARTDHIDTAIERLAVLLSEPSQSLTRLQAYEFAQSYIADKNPNSSNAADRLYYLAMFSRSMMLAAPLALILEALLLNRRDKQKCMLTWGKRRLALCCALAVVSSCMLFMMFSGFWESSIERTIRAFILTVPK